MRKSRAPELRKLLRGPLSAGATVGELCAHMGIPPDTHGTLDETLKNMPDAYVDRWYEAAGAPPAKVWCVVVPPDDMPKPERKRK